MGDSAGAADVGADAGGVEAAELTEGTGVPHAEQNFALGVASGCPHSEQYAKAAVIIAEPHDKGRIRR